MQENFEQDLEACLDTLRSGGVILYPTDTIWGLGCDPRNAGAVERIMELKQRPKNKSFLLLAADMEQVAEVAAEIPPGTAEQLAVSERPVTVIYPAQSGLAAGICAADGTVGIRVANDSFCHALARAFGGAITSTSANVSDQAFAGSFSDVPESILEGVDFAVQYRRAEKITSPASRIVKWTQGEGWLTIRP